jgi:uncharacterized membrane protein YebE (DUF533 family)
MLSTFFSEQNLTFEHVKCLTNGMFAVAKVDGVHDREMAMIREFYESCARAGDPRLEEVVRQSFDIADAKRLFEGAEMSKLFVKSLILLAFADGSYAREEDALIRNIAGQLGLDDTAVDGLHQSTKEFLLSSLAHVQNLDALKEVARRLDMQ